MPFSLSSSSRNWHVGLCLCSTPMVYYVRFFFPDKGSKLNEEDSASYWIFIGRLIYLKHASGLLNIH